MSATKWVKVVAASPSHRVNVQVRIADTDKSQEETKTLADGPFEISEGDLAELGPDGLRAVALYKESETAVIAPTSEATTITPTTKSIL